MEGINIDVRSSNCEFEYQSQLLPAQKIQDDDIEDIIDDPARFHRKLLECGIIDPDYAEFLTELNHTGKYEKDSHQRADQYYMKELDRVKYYYESQTQNFREDTEQAMNKLQEENQTLYEKCNFLTEQLNQLQSDKPKKIPGRLTTKNTFQRRSSENSQFKGKYKNIWKNPSTPRNDNTSQSREYEDSQIQLEAANTKLKKKVDELTSRAKRLKSSWETKIEEQKKEIQSLQTDSKELRTKLSQQKSKSLRDIAKQKDINSKLEKEVDLLNKSLRDLEKEKIQIKNRLERTLAEKSSKYRDNNRADLSRSGARSQNDADLYNKNARYSTKPQIQPISNRKSSHISKRENRLFSSTNSLQPFNLFKTTKNSKAKNSGKDRVNSNVNRVKSPKDSNTSTKHKTCSRKGICSVGLSKRECRRNHSKASGSSNSLNRTSLQFKSTTSAMNKIKDMCQMMVDSCSRLECARCFNMYPPTDFLDHINTKDQCKINYANPDMLSNENERTLDSQSPVIKKSKKKNNKKENNLDEINPMSERGSMGSIKKSMRSSIKRRMLPPQDRTMKEGSIAHYSNLSYRDRSYNEENYNNRNNQTLNNLHLRDSLSCKNNLNPRKKIYDGVHQSMDTNTNMLRNSVMTPVNNHANGSFVLQPHCQGPILQSQCNLNYTPNCYHYQQDPSVIDSQTYGPTIEDRLENTEKLIQEMNNKFEGLTSPKQSAKNEFNKLVKTLTMNSALQDYNVDSDSENEHNSEQSSIDEETLNMNQRDLKKYFKQNMKKQKTDRENSSEEMHSSRNMPSQKYPDRAHFSNSRYENVEDDELDQLYSSKRNKYESSEERSNGYDQNEHNEESSSDQLYEKAKNAINRRKMMISSEQNSEFLNDISSSEHENQLQMLKISSRRVENILRNKQKRRNQPISKEETLDKLRQNKMSEDSDSCQIQMSSEFDHESIEQNMFNEKQNSRNKLYGIMDTKDILEGRKFHQTTSSGNLVLYDSVERMSSQSPQEYINPEYIQRLTQKENYPHDSDEDDLLEDDNIADENIAYIDQDYEEEETEEQIRYRRGLNQYVNQMSQSKFKN
ncbi:unnamed protein product [Moneuplotes crassus]|uniref:Uncharacterized protein n=1 Tax=Euplotes crassus TaxID=5936 RepID=A0AAD1XRX2_EUPCR|nr:unnamed protein product [Moneuplotes crassus]